MDHVIHFKNKTLHFVDGPWSFKAPLRSPKHKTLPQIISIIICKKSDWWMLIIGYVHIYAWNINEVHKFLLDANAELLNEMAINSRILQKVAALRSKLTCLAEPDGHPECKATQPVKNKNSKSSYFSWEAVIQWTLSSPKKQVQASAYLFISCRLWTIPFSLLSSIFLISETGITSPYK